jgi:DNA-binding NarL/FixJ family response regulator
VYRIILAEDHVLVRQGIGKIIEDIGDLKVVGEVRDGLQLLKLLRELPVEMVILDISIPGLSGIEATKEIKKGFPGVKVLILTMHKKREYLNDAIVAGADGYLLKEDAARELISAIDTIRQGGFYISPLLANEMANLYVQSQRAVQARPLAASPLTSREIEVIRLIAEGKSSKEIAELLYLSFRTIQNHRTKIMKKLNLRKSADLIKYAIQKGYVTDIIS